MLIIQCDTINLMVGMAPQDKVCSCHKHQSHIITSNTNSLSETVFVSTGTNCLPYCLPPCKYHPQLPAYIYIDNPSSTKNTSFTAKNKFYLFNVLIFNF